MLSDIRHASRLLARTRGFSTAAIAIISLAVGSNLAIFSTIATAAGTLVTIGTIAALVPARKAARIDSINTLGVE